MLICFGCSWPTNIIKSLRSRTAKGKSLMFSLFVWVGYSCQIVGKLVSHNVNWVMIIYVLDFLMVTADIMLTIRNIRLDKERDKVA